MVWKTLTGVQKFGRAPNEFDNGRGLYTAFIGGFDAAEPVSEDQDQKASDGSEGNVEIADSVQGEFEPPSRRLAEREAKRRKKQVEQKPSSAPAANGMIKSADEKGGGETEENDGKVHVAASEVERLPMFTPTSGDVGVLLRNC